MVEAFPGDRFISRVNEIACKGCGTCVSVCPTGAMEQVHYERARLHRMFSVIEPGTTKVLFVCRWSRPEALHLPQNVLVVDLQCTGRMTPSMIVEAVRRGSPAVLVCGCREDACHYGFGRELGVRVAGRSNDILGLLGYDRRTVTTVACDPAGFHEAVAKWARGRR
jgi:heterodisulfide reductase subunit A